VETKEEKVAMSGRSKSILDDF